MGEVAGRAEQDEAGRVGHALEAQALAQRVVQLRRASCACRTRARRSSRIVRGASRVGFGGGVPGRRRAQPIRLRGRRRRALGFAVAAGRGHVGATRS